jgi:hypothetical protein
MTERGVLFVSVLLTIEQWVIIAGTVWLIGWKGWSLWTIVPAVLLLLCSSPSLIVGALSRHISKAER